MMNQKPNPTQKANNPQIPTRPVQKTAQPSPGANISSLTRRVRMLEERYTKASNRMDMDEHALIDFKKKVNIEIRTINSDLDDIKRDIADIKEKITMIVKELKTTARKGDVNVLKKYLDLWEPLNFITRDEFEKKIKELKNNNQKL